MKRLDEILSKTVSSGSSEDPSAASSATADETPDDACPTCGGAGFVRVERPLDHPRFGKAEPCSCVLTETPDVRRSRLERLSNLASLSRFTLESFASPETGEAAPTAIAARYAAEPAGWLVMTGSSGTGKTHLAAAIANHRVTLGHPALFMVVADLLDQLRASYASTDEDLGFEQTFDQVRNAPFLVLDDIDAVAPTDWTREKLLQVVNHRFNAQLPTVFTCASGSFANLDERIASRLRAPGTLHIHLGAAAQSSRYEQIGGMTRDRLQDYSFATFDPRATGLSPAERDSLQSASRLAMEFADQPHGWLTFQGVNGCGKTHLAAAIANKVLGRGGEVYFAVVPDLLDHLRASFAPDRESAYDEVFERLRTVPLLILDDLGAQHTSSWAQEKLYQIVNYRTVSALPTVVTTDRTAEELLETYPRIAARILDPKVGMVARIIAPHYSLGTAASSRPRRR